MKKFKLIKEYPNSCSLGTIFTQLENSNDFYTGKLNRTVRFSSEWKLDYFTKNPEYYEEVIEKDYEILSFRGITSKIIFPLLDTGMYSGKHTLNDMLEVTKSGDFEIHSIRRLSDGEVFTVDDKVKCWDGVHKLSKIYFYKNNLRFWMSHQIDIANDKSNGYTLDHIQKAKTPLFTTEDGVDVYQGDDYFICYKKNPKTIGSLKAHKALNEKYMSKAFNYFSTKEAAEEYILMNKPCLSINDVLTAKNTKTFSKLKQLVKSRL